MRLTCENEIANADFMCKTSSFEYPSMFGTDRDARLPTNKNVLLTYAS